MIELNASVVLASASPRRRELLARIIPSFAVRAADVDENVALPPVETVTLLAQSKARAVAELCPDALIIGADTIVVHDGRILGKPLDAIDAFRMLSGLSGCVHEVYTGVSLAFNGKASTFYETSAVTFRQIGEKEIQRYVESGSPFDKAGGYGIQDSDFVTDCRGSLFNVMGLPVERLERELSAFLKENGLLPAPRQPALDRR